MAVRTHNKIPEIRTGFPENLLAPAGKGYTDRTGYNQADSDNDGNHLPHIS